MAEYPITHDTPAGIIVEREANQSFIRLYSGKIRSCRLTTRGSKYGKEDSAHQIKDEVRAEALHVAILIHEEGVGENAAHPYRWPVN